MRTQRAFTLLEVLVAMGLFTIVGFAVVVLMRTGVDMWLGGSRIAQQEDRLELSLPRLEEDVRMVHVPPQVDTVPYDPNNPDPEREPDPLAPPNRMISGAHEYKIGDRIVPARYWGFVRELGRTELDTYVSRAGTNPEADAYIDGRNDEEEFKHNRHRATGGVVEVLYIVLPDDRRPGVSSLCRAFRTPIGGPGTLLDPKTHDTLTKVRQGVQPEPILSNVLHFDILFWTQFTTTWEYEEGSPQIIQRPRSTGQTGVASPYCGPSAAWDSTRGILPEKVFRLRKEKSLGFTADDIWPRRVRITLAVAEDETELVDALGPDEREFTVVGADFATGRGDLYGRFLKIEDEWVRIEARDPGRRDRFDVSRGALGTGAAAHPADAKVYYGRMMEFVVSIPSYRDDNN
ncbi:MAG: type II secretion system protein J [Planctomycetota bacterium]